MKSVLVGAWTLFSITLAALKIDVQGENNAFYATVLLSRRFENVDHQTRLLKLERVDEPLDASNALHF